MKQWGVFETCFLAFLDWTTPAFGVGRIFSRLKQNPPMGLLSPILVYYDFFPLCTVEVPTILAWGSFEDGSTCSYGMVLPELQAYSSACAPITPQLTGWGGPLQTLETQSLSSPWFLPCNLRFILSRIPTPSLVTMAITRLHLCSFSNSHNPESFPRQAAGQA